MSTNKANLIILMVTIGLVMIAGSAIAKGNNTYIYISNCEDHMNSTNDIQFEVFNGKDMECGSPRRTYRLEPGEVRRVGCRGQGKGRCRVEAVDSGEYSGCKNVDRGDYFTATNDGGLRIGRSDGDTCAMFD